MPKVTGYKLREAIKQWNLRKDAIERLFATSLKQFPGEHKDPKGLVEKFERAELAIAKLQAAQVAYNAHVPLPVGALPGVDSKANLALGIKMLGGLGRVEKMWRKAAGEKEERYVYGSNDERDPSKEYALPTIAPEVASEYSLKAAKVAAKARASVALANATEIELEIPEDLFE